MESEIIKIKKKINEYRDNNSYILLEKAILKYIDKGYGIYDKLLNAYINCLNNLEKYDEAKRYTDILFKYFPGSYSKSYQVKLYIDCNYIGVAYEMLMDDYLSFNGKDLFTIGKRFMLNGNYSYALFCYEEALKICNDNKIINTINEDIGKINNYYNKGYPIEKNYRYFKECNGFLHEGLIVTGIVEGIVEKEYKEKYNKTHYLIISKDKDKLYCVPVFYNMPSELDDNAKEYTLSKEDYKEFTKDRYVSNKIECIRENKVYRVVAKISVKDFNNIYDMIVNTKEEYIKAKKLKI